MTDKPNKVSIADLAKRRRDAAPRSIEARLLDERKGAAVSDARRLRRGTSATVQLNVRLPEAAKADVYKMAEDLNMTIAEVVEEAIGLLKAARAKQ